jgi:cell division protein FtsA
MTGMDTRIGYPNEHLAPGTPDEMASPMYATGIGLVIQGIERYLREKVKEDIISPERDIRSVEKDIKSPEKEKVTEKEIKIQEKIQKKPKSDGFLKRIQDWFEGDEM